MGLTVEIQGKDKLIAAIEKIPEIAMKNMRVALKEALHEVEVSSRENHKYISRTGNADKAYRTEVDDSGAFATLQLDGQVSQAPYIFPLHEGHKAYKVAPVNKKALYWVSATGTGRFRKGYTKKSGKFVHALNANEFYSKGHTIPAASGDPFLYRAFEEKKDDCVEIIREAIAKTIKEAGF